MRAGVGDVVSLLNTSSFNRGGTVTSEVDKEWVMVKWPDGYEAKQYRLALHVDVKFVPKSELMPELINSDPRVSKKYKPRVATLLGELRRQLTIQNERNQD